MVPVTVAEHYRLDVFRQDLEPTHVLDDTGRRHACVEEDRPLATAGRHANERREAGLCDQGIGQAVVGEGRGCARLREMVKPGRALDMLRREEQGSVTLSIRIVIRTASTGASGIVTMPTPSMSTRWRRRARKSSFQEGISAMARNAIARVLRGSVACLRNRQRAAGTRRVHQLGHARARAGTQDTPRRADLQEKRDRECPAVPASTALEPPW